MMRRGLQWTALAVMLFAVSMNMGHIGSEWLWTVIIVAAGALILILQRKPQDAGRRLRH